MPGLEAPGLIGDDEYVAVGLGERTEVELHVEGAKGAAEASKREEPAGGNSKAEVALATPAKGMNPRAWDVIPRTRILGGSCPHVIARYSDTALLVVADQGNGWRKRGRAPTRSVLFAGVAQGLELGGDGGVRGCGLGLEPRRVHLV